MTRVRELVAAVIERLPRRPIGEFLRLIRDHLDVILILGLVACILWLVLAAGLRGRRLALWLLVPALLAVALACIVGPDRLFPKRPYEGPNLITLSENHAVTLLDVPGLLFGGAAVILVCWLLLDRWRGWRRRRARRGAAR